MGILFSGADEGACRDSVGPVLDRLGTSAWREPDALLSVLADKQASLPEGWIVWLYRAPFSAVLDASTGAGQAPDAVLGQWFRRNLAALNARGREGIKLIFANIDRVHYVDFPAIAAGSMTLEAIAADAQDRPDNECGPGVKMVLGHLFSSVAPRFSEVFGALEAAAVLPGFGDACHGSVPPTETQLMELVEALRMAASVPGLRQQQAELMSIQATARARLEASEAALLQTRGEVESAQRDAAEALAKACRGEQEQEFFQLQLHQVQEELESHYRGLIEAGKEADGLRSELCESQQLAAAFRIQVEQLQEELLVQASIPRGVEMPTRAMATTLARRLASRIVPGPLRRYLAGKRLRKNNAQTLAPLRASEWFDPAWYLAKYDDVREAGTDPVEHYHNFGWKEGRDPGPRFDTRYYLESNSDVRRSGVDPLLHFVEYGMNEGRRPRESSPEQA